jgi:hypothetical protein
MTIKQQGGIFGRNPTFNNVTVDGTLTVDQVVEKTPAGGITLDGVTLKDGNVVLGDGKGIDFSATAGAGTSELFDDYEEGLWTPTVAGGTTPGTTTYVAQLGYYTKIGQIVHVIAYVQWSAQDGTGALQIGGLPFTSKQTFFQTPGVVTPSNLTFTAGSNLSCAVASGATHMNIAETANGSPQAFVVVDGDAVLFISASYMV